MLCIAAVLAGLALPSYQTLIAHQQLRTAVGDLFSAIDLTRSQALARGSRVLLVPLDPGGASWQHGWNVFIDSNGNRRYDAGEELIFQQGPVADGITINAAFSADAASSSYIAYNGAGRSCSASNSLAAHWGTLSLVQGQNRRNIKINMLGRVRVCDPATQNNCSSAADAE